MGNRHHDWSGSRRFQHMIQVCIVSSRLSESCSPSLSHSVTVRAASLRNSSANSTPKILGGVGLRVACLLVLSG
eukprot:3515969-Rhodomonas_salina.3